MVSQNEGQSIVLQSHDFSMGQALFTDGLTGNQQNQQISSTNADEKPKGIDPV